MNTLLVRNFLTINYNEARQSLAPRITSFLFVYLLTYSMEQSPS